MTNQEALYRVREILEQRLESLNTRFVYLLDAHGVDNCISLPMYKKPLAREMQGDKADTQVAIVAINKVLREQGG